MSPQDSHRLFTNLRPLPFYQSDIEVRGKTYKSPRLQCWMANPEMKSKAELYTREDPVPWSNDMLAIKNELEEMFEFGFDYVLMNLYRDGKDYISLHSDREAISNGKNVIASLSLGASRRFILKNNKDPTKKHEFLLVSGSLLVMAGTTQQHWKHTVPKQLKVNDPRLNLTFRKS
uniref:Fe2OG dioxygenase domain-containing protein n=1 Tax=Arcella intermedia TaxID=1963864 RepID=A0A6B2LLU1_9EUKA